jgi:ribosomal protein S18 acetylase RimI-like enzyme
MTTNEISLRPADSSDEAFLYELYYNTHVDEFAAAGLEEAQLRSLMKLQFTARQRHYEIAFPGAEHQIVLCDNNPVGRMLVFRSSREVRLVDIAISSSHRGSGLGGSLVCKLCDEAAAAKKPVTLHVAKTNRAARLYQRLGFRVVDELGGDYKMEWKGISLETSNDRIPND